MGDFYATTIAKGSTNLTPLLAMILAQNPSNISYEVLTDLAIISHLKLGTGSQVVTPVTNVTDLPLHFYPASPFLSYD